LLTPLRLYGSALCGYLCECGFRGMSRMCIHAGVMCAAVYLSEVADCELVSRANKRGTKSAVFMGTALDVESWQWCCVADMH